MNIFKKYLPFLNSLLIVAIFAISLYTLFQNRTTNPSSISTETKSRKTEVVSDKPVDGFLTYVNTYQKVKIKYPEDWIKKEYDQNVFVEFKKSPDWDFNIVNFSMTSNPSLTEYKDRILSDIGKYKNYNLLSQEETKIIGLPAFKLVYTANFEKQYKIMQYYIVDENHAYSLTYRSTPDKFDDMLPQIQTMVDSFEILQ